MPPAIPLNLHVRSVSEIYFTPHKVQDICKKAFDKMQHLFMIKTLNKMVVEANYLNKIKAMYDKPSDNIILNGEKLKVFPL